MVTNMKLHCIIQDFPKFNQVMMTFHNGKYEFSKLFKSMNDAKKEMLTVKDLAIKAISKKYAEPMDFQFDGTFEVKK